MRNKKKSVKFKNFFSMLVMALILCLENTSCRLGDNPTESDPSTISIWYGGDEQYFGHCWGMDPRFLVFDPLIIENDNGELEGRLAESWEHSPDFNTWTIHLHRNIMWHDGAPFTVHDIKFTLDLMTHPDVYTYTMMKPGSFSMEIYDDYTYTIEYYEGSTYHPLRGWNTYYPKHLLENLDPKELCDWEFWTNPVGNGKYRFIRCEPKVFVELELFPDYYRKKPRIERVVLKFGGNPLTELLSSNVDAAVGVGRSHVVDIAKNPNFLAYYGVTGLNEAIYWNQNNNKFQDPRVRRALTMAINRRELHEVLYMPENLPLFLWPYNYHQFMRGEVPDPHPYDPEGAIKLLEEVGWKDSDGDGILEKGGEEFRFTGIVRTYKESEAVYVKDQLSRIGVRMEILTLATGLIRERLNIGKFDALFFIARDGEASLLFGEDSPVGYHNAHFIELVEAKRATLDSKEKERINREMWSLLKRDMPCTHLYHELYDHIAHRRVRGLRSPGRCYPIENIEYLWIEEEKP